MENLEQRLLLSSISLLQWEDKSGDPINGTIPEGTTIYLAAYASGYSASQVFTAEVMEYDPISADDLVTPNIQLESCGTGKWRAPWVACWTSDPAGGNPEYYFKFDTPSKQSQHNIQVSPSGLGGISVFTHTQGSGIPLILVHGDNSEEAGQLSRWETLANYIVTCPGEFSQYDVYVWKHTTSEAIGFGGTTGQAAALEAYVNSQFGSSTPIAFVAHSQGGLVVRAFMNHDNQGNRVLGVLTLGTPHHGSPFAVPDWDAIMWGDRYGILPADLINFHILVGPGPVLGQGLDTNRAGSMDLGWDNMDSIVTGSYLAVLNASVLNQDDMNDNLAYLNSHEAYKYKIVTYAAYDDNLVHSDSMAESVNVGGDLSLALMGEHDQLAVVTSLLQFAKVM